MGYYLYVVERSYFLGKKTIQIKPKQQPCLKTKSKIVPTPSKAETNYAIKRC